MQTVYVVLQGVKRAADALAAAVEHVGVDRGGTHILVTEELLDGPDVVARLQQMSGEGMPEGVAPHMLDDARRADGLLHRPLNHGLVNMVPSLFACTSGLLPRGLGKDTLPAAVGGRVRVLPVQGGRQNLQRSDKRCGQHGHAILPALAVVNRDLAPGEIGVLDP
jgi:hypothetical protein